MSYLTVNVIMPFTSLSMILSITINDLRRNLIKTFVTVWNNLILNLNFKIDVTDRWLHKDYLMALAPSHAPENMHKRWQHHYCILWQYSYICIAIRLSSYPTKQSVWLCPKLVVVQSSEGVISLCKKKRKPAAPAIPRRSPIQVLSRPDVA